MKPKNGTKKGSEIMNTHTHLVLIPEVLEEDGVTSSGENVNITKGVSDIWAERRSGGPHIHGFGFLDPGWNLEETRTLSMEKDKRTSLKVYHSTRNNGWCGFKSGILRCI